MANIRISEFFAKNNFCAYLKNGVVIIIDMGNGKLDLKMKLLKNKKFIMIILLWQKIKSSLVCITFSTL